MEVNYRCGSLQLKKRKLLKRTRSLVLLCIHCDFTRDRDHNRDTQPRGCIFSGDFSMMQLHCALGNRKSQARSATIGVACLFYAEEWIEYARDCFFGNARAIVANRNAGVAAVFSKREMDR